MMLRSTPRRCWPFTFNSHIRYGDWMVRQTRYYSQDAPHLDFRLFVDALREDGDLADINQEVDPHLEVAAITRRIYERRAKAALFNNVKDNQDGLFRIL